MLLVLLVVSIRGSQENATINAITRQLMLQQLYVEELTRSGGTSGLKRIRMKTQGTRPYHATTHTMRSVASIHDHANNIRTVGMGELIAVLNGLEFRTRHNDYRLYMPSETSKNYHSVQPILLPDVPPKVRQQTKVEDQIIEMKEWFKAWKDQDYSVRDYRPYFKPVLCYLEGAWTSSDGDSLDESFDSDRHFIDAASWHDLQDKIRFASYSGRKDSNENYAYLPTTIIDVVNGTPIFAQWNYRILCHPISGDLPLNRFRVVDDLATRMSYKRTVKEHSNTRSARFELNDFDEDVWRDGHINYGLMDKLMAEIPGKDNYPGELVDDGFGEVATSYIPKAGRGQEEEPLNTAYYHRMYRVSQTGAMGLQTRRRSINDETIYMAMTSQPKVASVKAKHCKGRGRMQTCVEYQQKWTYAIPLEIIYLTPLSQWNPYNIAYKGDLRSSTDARTVSANRRNGGKTSLTAYNGTNSKVYYLTPNDFFTADGEVGRDPADTVRNAVGVLDRNGDVKLVRASGTRIFIPNIPGAGVLRQRYPIMPVHGEGEPVWKEMEALKDILLEPKKFSYMFRENIKPTPPRGDDSNDNNEDDEGLYLKTSKSLPTPVGEHEHFITFTAEEWKELKSGKCLNTETTEANGHSHAVKVRCVRKCSRFVLVKCDGKRNCFDNHRRILNVLDGPEELTSDN